MSTPSRTSEAVQEPTTGKPDAAPESMDSSSLAMFENAEFEHPADVADHLEGLPLAAQLRVISSLSTEEAAGALAELDEHVRVELLGHLEQDVAAALVAAMSPDDAADMLDELDAKSRDTLLNNLDTDDAAEIRHLMAFDPDTAGGVMNTEVFTLEQTLTVDQAIAKMRGGLEEMEIPYYAYIIDGAGALVGVLSLRNLLISRSGALLADNIKDQTVISVRYDQHKEEVARMMIRYNFMAMPVVDEKGLFMGVVTHDDVMDIIQDIATEDMLGMVGAGQDETVDTPWRDSVTKRLPWLVVNMINSALSATVVYLFDGSIEKMAILAVLMPMVANQAGNTGQQALAVMIRQLVTERFDRRRAWGAVLREVRIGLVNGCIVGGLTFIVVFLFTTTISLAAVMACALLADMLLGALAGASIPLLLKALSRDPAQASSIFLTTITDGAGFFIFLGLATLFLL